MRDFLKTSEKKLDETFNSTCAFAKIQDLLMHHIGEMREAIAAMKINAKLLCTTQGETVAPQEASIVQKCKYVGIYQFLKVLCI